MKFSAAVLSATLVALASGVAAQLAVLSPGGQNLWFVGESDNAIAWSCKTSQYPTFTILIANTDLSVLAVPLVLVAQQANFDCSKLVTKDKINLKPATGYFIQLANSLNNTDVYAQSLPFEIKPFGAAYPATSATPTSVATPVAISHVPAAAASRSASSTSASTSRASTSSGTRTPTSTGTTQGRNGAAGLFAPAGIAAAAFAALGVVFG